MIKPLLIHWWRELLIAILICTVGYLATRKDKIKVETVVEYREKIVVKVEEKIKYVDKVQVKTRTIVKTKDGETRVQEETRTQERDITTRVREEQRKEIDHTRKESMVTQSAPARYVLGFGWDFNRSSYSGSLLVRPFPNVPISVGPVVTLQDRKFSLGVGIGVSL